MTTEPSQKVYDLK